MKGYAQAALVIALLALYPLVFTRYMNFGVATLLFAGFALSWDILGGWAGQSSLGHAALVGTGAYAVTILAESHVHPLWGALFGMVLAMVAACGAAVTFRLRGPYFTLASLAIGEIVRLVAINETWLTNGAEGKFVPELPTLFGQSLFDRKVEFYLALAYVALVLVVLLVVKGSRLGFYLRAVREDEEGAMALGVAPARVKLIAFVISATLTALGGALYAIFLQALDPHTLFDHGGSVQIALLAIIGGRGTVLGPLLGAFAIRVPEEMLRSKLGESNLFVYGVLLVVVVLFFPRGIVGTWNDWRYRVSRRKTGEAEP